MAIASVPNKAYAMNDTIHIDGYHCLVIKADTTGLHGVAMSYPSYEDKNWEKREKDFRKRMQKALDKMKISKAESEAAVADYVAQARVPMVTWENVKGGRIYYVEEYEKTLLPGWRLGGKKDIEALNSFMKAVTGGKSSRLNYRPTFMKNVDLTDEWKENFFQMKINGFLVKAEYKFAHKVFYGGDMDFYPQPEFIGNEVTILFKDF